MADRLLQWFCRSDLLDEIQGDLHEQFQRQVAQYGLRRAKWYYLMNVLSFIRPFVLRKKRDKYPNSTTMFRHNLLLTYRNFKRYKTSFFINLIGLSTGLACTLMIYLWVTDELNVDRFHEKDPQLFQVMKNNDTKEGIITMESTPGILARTLIKEMPEIEYATEVIPTSWYGEVTLFAEDTDVRASGQFVGKDYFNIFSYKLIHGNKDKVLSDKNAIVISEKLAMKLFNTTENVIGKVIEWRRDKQYFVSGVFENTLQTPLFNLTF